MLTPLIEISYDEPINHSDQSALTRCMTKEKPHPKKKKAPKPQGTTTLRDKKYQLGLALVLLLTFIVYLNSLKNGFITNWDDNQIGRASCRERV